jgi:PAS domain S-box-containing protein
MAAPANQDIDMKRSLAQSNGDTAVRVAAVAPSQHGRILLVDDDPDFLSSLSDLLQPEGYEVAVANGAKAARRATAEFEPDVALLDIKLGFDNGIELISTLKQQRPDLACLIMTGYADMESAVRALREGADDFLTKPIDPLILIRALKRCRQHQKLEQKNREIVAALKSSEERTRAITANVADALVTIDSEGIIESVNPAAATMFGYESSELIGENVAQLVDEEIRAEHVGKGPREVNGARKDGEVLELECTVGEAWIGSERVFIGVMRDISERKRLEAQLRQAQKMEAVGQLTGGVAHDFNNLLGVILGNAELLEDKVGAEDPYIQAVIRATGRGSELTQRLLAFSRLQPLQPRVLDPAQLLGGMSDLLTRTLAETIRIQFLTGNDNPRIEADPAQMESALLNLAINAGQAMPKGGALTIEIANETIDRRTAARIVDATPGRYVTIAVTDTGVGMAPKVVARAFDPFFTTKPVGVGSGLGLSMVYGFARQSGGFAVIESDLGQGTTVRLYLPHVEAETSRPETGLQAEAPRAKGETVLVVEDNAEVLDLSVTLLESLGYEVLSASEGARALEILENAPKIDLILSDVMLPGGLLGPEVVQRAKQTRPDLRVLFMSGYADAAARSSGLLAEGATVLSKPFRRYDLACQLRVAMAEPPGPGQKV